MAMLILVSKWKTVKARQLLSALFRLGWTETHRAGSHRKLAHPSYPTITFAFHDGDEVGSAILAKIAKKSNLTPDDL